MLLSLLLCPCTVAETRRRRRITETFAPDVEAASPLTGEADLWQVWPWSAVLPHSKPDAACRWERLAPPPTPGLRAPMNGSICLRQAWDLLCNDIIRDKYWRECADLPALYVRGSSGVAVSGGLFLDVGANIGACSMHMLLASDAPIMAFEPGVDNLFYASSSLLALGEVRPAQASLPRRMHAAGAARPNLRGCACSSCPLPSTVAHG